MEPPFRPGPVGGSATRPEPPSAWIRLAGGVDLATAPSLAGYANRLHGLALRLIVIDLTTVTYVGSTFLKFLTTLREGHPDSHLVLHNPPTLARTVIAVTGVDRHLMINIHPEPPAGSPGPDDAAMTIVPLGAGYSITGAAGWPGVR